MAGRWADVIVPGAEDCSFLKVSARLDKAPDRDPGGDGL